MPMALSNNWINKKNHKMSAVISYRAQEVNKKFSTKHKNIYMNTCIVEPAAVSCKTI